MTDDTQAETVDSGITFSDDAESIEESAPQEAEAVEGQEQETEEPKVEEQPESDRFQKRINKVTADKYEALQRAEKAEKELESLKNANFTNKSAEVEPKPEDFDFDDQAYQDAMIDYKVNQKAKEIQQQQNAAREQLEKEKIQRSFNEKALEFAQGKEDFQTALQAVPVLQPEVLNAVMVDEKGPEIAYYLGKHLDVADNLVSMSPMQAAIEIGRISAKLSAPKEIKLTQAPDPIKPVQSGGSVAQERGPQGATFE